MRRPPVTSIVDAASMPPAFTVVVPAAWVKAAPPATVSVAAEPMLSVPPLIAAPEIVIAVPWFDDPARLTVAPVALVSPPSVRVVAALRAPLPIWTPPVLASRPLIVRLLAPWPLMGSRFSVPLLLKSPLTTSAVWLSTWNVPLFVNGLARVSGLAKLSSNVPALLVNPAPPLLKARVAA